MGNFLRAYLRLSAVCAVALLAAGCAELRWQKSGGDTAMLEQDLGECQRQARIGAVPWAWPFGPATPSPIGLDARGRPIMAVPYPMESDRILLELDLTRSCMRSKGYELVPVEKR